MENSKGDILSNIKEIRNSKNLSQKDIAQKIGMKQSGFGLIENGARGLSYSDLLQIAMAFEMDVIDIITYPYKYKMDGNVVSNKNSDNTKIPEIPDKINFDSATAKVSVEITLNRDDIIKLNLQDRVLRVLQ
jgi:transcriptional regulator with XRE-family HTH domain